MGSVNRLFRKRTALSLLRASTVVLGLGIFGNFERLFPFAGLSSVAQAYPVLISAKQIPWMIGAKRTHLLAITKTESDQWTVVPSQSEEIEDDIAIVFRKPTEVLPVRQKLRQPKVTDPFDGSFEKFHRIIIDDQDLGICGQDCNEEAKVQALRLCRNGSAQSLLRVARIDLDHTKRTAFLVDCASEQPELPKSKTQVDKTKFLFSGKEFSFRYKNERSVMLDAFGIGTNGSSHQDVLSGTEMRISLKPKFMFNLDFDNKDVMAEISSVTHGPLSHGVEIATAFNLLIFQFNKQICCDINVFEDALYFPVMLDLPYGGESFQDGSGLFYGFKVADGTDFEYFPPPSEGQGQEGQGRDKKGRSSTAMTLARGNTVVAVGFGNLKGKDGNLLAPTKHTRAEMTAKGFSNLQSESGIFYDATKLPNGFNYFNIWLFVGERKDKDKLLDYARYGVTFRSGRVY